MFDKKDFHDLAADVAKTNACFGELLEKFGWTIFSESGSVEVDGYEVLADAFAGACTMNEAASELANELHERKRKILALRENYESSDDELTLAKWLVKWIGENFEDEIVEDHIELLPSYFYYL